MILNSLISKPNCFGITV